MVQIISQTAMAIRPWAIALLACPAPHVRFGDYRCHAFPFPRDVSIAQAWRCLSLCRWLTCPAVSAATVAHKKVYLLRGLTNVLSPGIDQLNEELQRRNIDVTIANHAFSDSLAREAIEGCKSGRIRSIVLVGHSLGASAAAEHGGANADRPAFT